MIKVGFCVAYDWEMLKTSLPRVYEHSDVICLAVDKDRHTWSCNEYSFDNEGFFSWVETIDNKKKIDVYEDDFSLTTLNARQNCNRHRELIAKRMGVGGWHIQIDCDEYFPNFGEFVQTLLKIHSNPSGREKPLNVHANLITIFKKLEDGFLLIENEGNKPETAPFATNWPVYERARHNGHFNVYSNELVLHESWARSEDDLNFKIANWGHSAEELEIKELQKSYLKLWKSLDQFNFFFVKNLHPARPKLWPALRFVEGTSIEDIFKSAAVIPKPYSDWELLLLNNRNLARVRFYLKKLWLMFQS